MTGCKQIIGYSDQAAGDIVFQGVNPATGIETTHRFYKATADEAALAATKAAAAFHLYSRKSGEEKAVFLERIAEDILAIGEELIKTCTEETALPPARIEGERGRTVNQLRMFAALVREGSWVDARIETAIPDRQPVPKPDLRYMQVALGPVLVFGASNFPLAFSVAGGDTASALAAGCPVVVKAHSAHPATSWLVGKAIRTAAQKCNMPDGVFSLLFGDGPTTGMELVKHPAIKAVGFTGSYKAGKALFDAAAARPEPIPVYAEMGSLNPVFILPGAMKERGETIAIGFAGSVTLGTGQFCTNPGLLICQQPDSAFVEKIKQAFEQTAGGSMLSETIYQAYQKGVQAHQGIAGVEPLAAGQATAGCNPAVPQLLKTSGRTFIAEKILQEEIFGPASILIDVPSRNELLDIARSLSGHLTVTLHGTDEDFRAYSELLPILQQKAGRIVINGFPTGVEVCSAMVHGGPFPATTDSRSTSVGTAAIYRFTRPVCFQNMPSYLLPPELQHKNVMGINRLINGKADNKDLI